jgi:hypothetical protein
MAAQRDAGAPCPLRGPGHDMVAHPGSRFCQHVFFFLYNSISLATINKRKSGNNPCSSVDFSFSAAIREHNFFSTGKERDLGVFSNESTTLMFHFNFLADCFR